MNNDNGKSRLATILETNEEFVEPGIVERVVHTTWKGVSELDDEIEHSLTTNTPVFKLNHGLLTARYPHASSRLLNAQLICLIDYVNDCVSNGVNVLQYAAVTNEFMKQCVPIVAEHWETDALSSKAINFEYRSHEAFRNEALRQLSGSEVGRIRMLLNLSMSCESAIRTMPGAFVIQQAGKTFYDYANAAEQRNMFVAVLSEHDYADTRMYEFYDGEHVRGDRIEPNTVIKIFDGKLFGESILEHPITHKPIDFGGNLYLNIYIPYGQPCVPFTENVTGDVMAEQVFENATLSKIHVILERFMHITTFEDKMELNNLFCAIVFNFVHANRQLGFTGILNLDRKAMFEMIRYHLPNFDAFFGPNRFDYTHEEIRKLIRGLWVKCRAMVLWDRCNEASKHREAHKVLDNIHFKYLDPESATYEGDDYNPVGDYMAWCDYLSVVTGKIIDDVCEAIEKLSVSPFAFCEYPISRGSFDYKDGTAIVIMDKKTSVPYAASSCNNVPIFVCSGSDFECNLIRCHLADSPLNDPGNDASNAIRDELEEEFEHKMRLLEERIYEQTGGTVDFGDILQSKKPKSSPLDYMEQLDKPVIIARKPITLFTYDWDVVKKMVGNRDAVILRTSMLNTKGYLIYVGEYLTDLECTSYMTTLKNKLSCEAFAVITGKDCEEYCQMYDLIAPMYDFFRNTFEWTGFDRTLIDSTFCLYFYSINSPIKQTFIDEFLRPLVELIARVLYLYNSKVQRTQVLIAADLAITWMSHRSYEVESMLETINLPICTSAGQDGDDLYTNSNRGFNGLMLMNEIFYVTQTFMQQLTLSILSRERVVIGHILKEGILDGSCDQYPRNFIKRQVRFCVYKVNDKIEYDTRHLGVITSDQRFNLVYVMFFQWAIPSSPHQKPNSVVLVHQILVYMSSQNGTLKVLLESVNPNEPSKRIYHNVVFGNDGFTPRVHPHYRTAIKINAHYNPNVQRMTSRPFFMKEFKFDITGRPLSELVVMDDVIDACINAGFDSISLWYPSSGDFQFRKFESIPNFVIPKEYRVQAYEGNFNNIRRFICEKNMSKLDSLINMSVSTTVPRISRSKTLFVDIIPDSGITNALDGVLNECTFKGYRLEVVNQLPFYYIKAISLGSELMFTDKNEKIYYVHSRVIRDDFTLFPNTDDLTLSNSKIYNVISRALFKLHRRSALKNPNPRNAANKRYACE